MYFRINTRNQVIQHTKWERWFAWHPVKLNTGKWRWLVTIGRRIKPLCIDWVYDEYIISGYIEYCPKLQLIRSQSQAHIDPAILEKLGPTDFSGYRT